MPPGASAGPSTARAWGCISRPPNPAVPGDPAGVGAGDGAAAAGEDTEAILEAARYRPAMPRGTLITIEGLDGAGKSTLARALADTLAARGAPVELLREPGGVPAAERIRALLSDPSLALDPHAEALLYAAARAQLVHERLRPLLAAGALVLLDRFLDSSLAYQGAARGLGVRSVGSLNEFATGGLRADRTLLLRISPAAGRARQENRGVRADRIEREQEAFFARVAAAYEEIARAEPRRVRAIDAEQPRRLCCALPCARSTTSST